MIGQQLNLVVCVQQQHHYMKMVTAYYNTPVWNTLCVFYDSYQFNVPPFLSYPTYPPAPPVTCLACLALNTGRYVDFWGRSERIASLQLFEVTEVVR